MSLDGDPRGCNRSVTIGSRRPNYASRVRLGKYATIGLGIVLLAAPPASLEAQTICIDPGHGGTDPGAIGCGLRETDINLDTSLRLRDLLVSAGFTVLMTRDTDVFVSLTGRANYANAHGADRFVAIHSNSAANTAATGIETYCAPGAGSLTLDLRDKIQAEMIATWPLANRGGKTANFTVLTNTSMPATLTELAFVVNCGLDAVYLGSPAERQRAAEAHLRAIQQHFGIQPPATGELLGVVFEDQGSGTNDTSVRLSGATVTIVETGDQMASSAASGSWSFQLLGGSYTVTAELAGYQSAQRSCAVQAGASQWCSIGLFPAAPPPDAGVVDSGGQAPDASAEDARVEDAGMDPQADASATKDAGIEAPDDAGGLDGSEPSADAASEMPPLDPTQEGGCGCAAVPSHRAAPTGLLLLLAGFLLPLRRRRLCLVLVPLILAGLATAASAQTDVRIVAPWLEIQEARVLLDEGPTDAPVIAPSGKLVAVSGPHLTPLYLVSIDSGAVKVISLGRGAGYLPAWTPDSTGIGLRNPKDPFADQPLKLVDLEGVFQGPYPTNGELTPLQKNDEVWLRTPDGEKRISGDGDRYYQPILSPDGRFLVYSGLRTGLHLYRIADGLQVRLGQGDHPSFAPGSDLLLFDRTRDDGLHLTAGDLFVTDLTRSDLRTAALTRTPDRIELYPSVSADGRTLSFTADGGLYVAQLVRRRE